LAGKKGTRTYISIMGKKRPNADIIVYANQSFSPVLTLDWGFPNPQVNIHISSLEEIEELARVILEAVEKARKGKE